MKRRKARDDQEFTILALQGGSIVQKALLDNALERIDVLEGQMRLIIIAANRRLKKEVLPGRKRK